MAQIVCAIVRAVRIEQAASMLRGVSQQALKSAKGKLREFRSGSTFAPTGFDQGLTQTAIASDHRGQIDLKVDTQPKGQLPKIYHAGIVAIS